MIESISLSAEKLAEYYDVMAKGNTVLRGLVEMAGMENREFRAKFFKGKFSPADWPGLNSAQIAQIVQAIPAIQGVRDIEWTMMRGFSRLAHRHANSWVRKLNLKGPDADDYVQEAFLALLDAIYGYTNKSVKFITYAWWVIHNRLTNVANKNNPLGQLTNEAIALLKRYNEVKQSFNYNANDEEIFAAAGFDAEQRAVLEKAMVKVVSMSQIPYSSDEGDTVIADYTAGRRGINSERDTVPCNYEVREAIDRAGLTDIERKVVEISLCPHYGWQTELAKTIINPRTGQPVSKMSVSLLLKKALGKIKSAYLKRSVA